MFNLQGTPTKEERVSSFLEALTKLTKEHGIEVVGCGCCGSPFLMSISGDSDVLGYNLEFEEDKQQYVLGREG